MTARPRTIPWRSAALALWLAALADAPATVWDQSISTEGPVDIHVSSAMETIPLRGHYPVRVRINNRSDQPGQWTIQTTASPSYEPRANLRSRHTLRVDAREARTVDLMVPVYPVHSPDRYVYPRLQIEAIGPGAVGHSIHRSGDYSAGAGYHLGMSRDLATRSKSELEAVATGRAEPMVVSRLALDAWPDDPRALSGLDVVLLFDTEWRDLKRSTRDALKQWLAAGGTLLVASREAEAGALPAGLETGHGAWPADWRYGWGRVRPLPAPDGVADVQAALKWIEQQPSLYRLVSGGYQRLDWPLRREIPDVRQPLLWITVTVFIVALVIGPLNIWIAARRRRSTQLLWTTPALSLLASAGIGLSIIWSDGTGAYGHRALFTFLIPADQLELRLQEQTTRSGVLLNRSFHVPPEVVLSVVNATGLPDKSSGFRRDPDGGAAGAWFTSRAIHGHLLESVQSSRSGVTLRPADDPDGAPTVWSTIPATLSTLYVTGADGRHWRAGPLRAGESRTLEPVSDKDYAAAWRHLRAGGRMTRALDNVRDAPGLFFGVAEPERDAFIASLPAIRWRSETHYIAGYLTLEATP